MLPNSEVVDMKLPDFTEVLQEAEQVLRQCFTEHKLEEIFLSFNGGKDCTVLLDITIHVLKELSESDDVSQKLKVVYIRTSGPFKEIEDFVMLVKQHYGVELIVSEGDMKATLQRLLNEDDQLKVCLMGTRRTDPFCENLKFTQKTDPNWPQILRVSPLLNWSYHQIWSYVHDRKVPYCTLYDKGYTSIGSTQNTWPNPSLGYKDRCGCLSYLPAWQLPDGSLERAGRGSPPKPLLNGHSTSNHIDNGYDTNDKDIH